VDDFGSGRNAMRSTPLIENLAYLKFSYFGAPDPQHLPQWRDEWRGAAVLPRLVSVHMGLRRPNGILETVETVLLRQQ
jgi:hypothetical protein